MPSTASANQRPSRSTRRRGGGAGRPSAARPSSSNEGDSWSSRFGRSFFGEDRWCQIGTQRGVETSRKLYCETDSLCILFMLVYYTGFLWIGFHEWFAVVIQTCCTASAFELLVPGLVFEPFMPHHVAVLFEEATVVVEDTGYQAESKPFIRFGNTILCVVSKTVFYCFFQTYTNREKRIILYAADLGIHYCLMNRQWQRTGEQYLRKLRLRLQASCADRVVTDAALNVLRTVEEDRIFWGYRFLQPEEMKATAEMLRQGTPRCIDFLHEALEKTLRSPDPTHELPLFKQWQQFKVTREALERVLPLREDIGGAEGERWIVTGAQRQQITGRLKQMPLREKMFFDLAKTVEGSHEDTLSALLEFDRRASRRRRADSAPTSAAAEVSADVPADVEAEIKLETDTHANPRTEPMLDLQVGLQAHQAIEATAQPQERILECVCCFDRPAEVVFVGCGHLSYCKACRKRALKQAGGIRSYSRLLRRRVACPLCRQESRTVELCEFTGFVFKP